MANNEGEITIKPNGEEKPLPKPPTARLIVEHRSDVEGGNIHLGDSENPTSIPNKSDRDILSRILGKTHGR